MPTMPAPHPPLLLSEARCYRGPCVTRAEAPLARHTEGAVRMENGGEATPLARLVPSRKGSSPRHGQSPSLTIIYSPLDSSAAGKNPPRNLLSLLSLQDGFISSETVVWP